MSSLASIDACGISCFQYEFGQYGHHGLRWDEDLGGISHISGLLCFGLRVVGDSLNHYWCPKNSLAYSVGLWAARLADSVARGASRPGQQWLNQRWRRCRNALFSTQEAQQASTSSWPPRGLIGSNSRYSSLKIWTCIQPRITNPSNALGCPSSA